MFLKKRRLNHCKNWCFWKMIGKGPHDGNCQPRKKLISRRRNAIFFWIHEKLGSGPSEKYEKALCFWYILRKNMKKHCVFLCLREKEISLEGPARSLGRAGSLSEGPQVGRKALPGEAQRNFIYAKVLCFMIILSHERQGRVFNASSWFLPCAPNLEKALVLL